MTYKIGTRVKKVGGSVNLGMTGVVVSGPAHGGWTLDRATNSDCDMYVRSDTKWVANGGGFYPSGSVCMTPSSMWEPILLDKTPCESDFKESLDKLLSEVREREAV